MSGRHTKGFIAMSSATVFSRSADQRMVLQNALCSKTLVCQFHCLCTIQ